MIGAVLDHLWQSTLLALGVGLLTLAFRKAGPAVRHGLWFAASVKFLVPFAALEALGKALAPAVHVPAGAAPAEVFIAQAAQPFSHPYAMASAAPVAAGFDPALILAAVWAIGCAAVLIGWMVRGGQVRAAMRSATPLAWPAPMPVMASTSLLEPGLVGLRRPVLLVPDTLFDHLDRPEIAAIVAHEACHLRRRDNLTAAIHMLVEALFWFHPLVWWMGARMIEEREQACDESVVRSGHDPAAYARSLVECCRLYLQSPLPCAAGASGSNLRARVERIMTAPPSLPLSASAKAVLLTASLCALASPVAAGLLTSPAVHEAAVRATAVVASLAAASDEDARLTAPAPRAATAPRKMRLTKAMEPSPDQASPARPGPAADDGERFQLAELEVRQPTQLDLSPASIPPARQPPAPSVQPVAPPKVEVANKTNANAADPDQLVCQTEAITGSRFVKRVCLTELERKEDQRRLLAFERANYLDPTGYPATSNQVPGDSDAR